MLGESGKKNISVALVRSEDLFVDFWRVYRRDMVIFRGCGGVCIEGVEAKWEA